MAKQPKDAQNLKKTSSPFHENIKAFFQLKTFHIGYLLWFFPTFVFSKTRDL